MATINIGTEINLEDLVASRMLIQANSGGGKSVTARVIMEESFGKIPFICFDRDGEYYTLKEAFPDLVVIGGSFPDLQLSVPSAALLPKEIVANRLNVIVDLSDLKSGQKQQYVKEFLEALMDLPQTHWTPYLIFIEEAHFFCGEQDKNPAGPAVRELMAGGRKKGYCGILITQRISKLHKDAAAECNNKLVGRTNLDIDMDRAAKELGFSNAAARLGLRDLKPGNFFAYGTSIEPHHVHQVTIKLPKTKQPKAGTITTIKPGKPTEKVLSALQKLNDLPKEAEKEKKTIAGLEAEVARLNGLVGNSHLLNQANERIAELNNSSKEAHENYIAAVKTLKQKDALIHHYQNQTDALLKILGTPTPLITVNPELPKIDNSPGAILREARESIPPISKSFTEHNQRFSDTVHRKAADAATSNPGSLGKCALAIFRFLASFPTRKFSKAQVGIATGYSPSSGGFNNALSELNSKDLIFRDAGSLQVNVSDGTIQRYLGADFKPQRYSIHTYLSKLGKCEREIYQVLLDHPRSSFSKEELAKATSTGYSATSGGFNNALSTLNSLELIKRSNGAIQLNPELLEI